MEDPKVVLEMLAAGICQVRKIYHLQSTRRALAEYKRALDHEGMHGVLLVSRRSLEQCWFERMEPDRSNVSPQYGVYRHRSPSSLGH